MAPLLEASASTSSNAEPNVNLRPGVVLTDAQRSEVQKYVKSAEAHRKAREAETAAIAASVVQLEAILKA
jgi:hypothetical protein